MVLSLLMNDQNPQKNCASCHCLTALPPGRALSSAKIPKYWFLREMKGIFSGKHLIIQHKTENCTLKMAPQFTLNREFSDGLKWFGLRQTCRTRQKVRKQTQEIIQIDQFTYTASVLGLCWLVWGFFSSRVVSPNPSTLSLSPPVRSQVSKPKVLRQIWGVSEWTSQYSAFST